MEIRFNLFIVKTYGTERPIRDRVHISGKIANFSFPLAASNYIPERQICDLNASPHFAYAWAQPTACHPQLYPLD